MRSPLPDSSFLRPLPDPTPTFAHGGCYGHEAPPINRPEISQTSPVTFPSVRAVQACTLLAGHERMRHCFARLYCYGCYMLPRKEICRLSYPWRPRHPTRGGRRKGPAGIRLGVGPHGLHGPRFITAAQRRTHRSAADIRRRILNIFQGGVKRISAYRQSVH